MRRALTALRYIMVSLLVTLLAAQESAQIMTLEQCVDSALANDRRVRMASLDEEMAALRIGEAKAGLIPKVRGAAEFRHYTDLPYQLLPSSFFGGDPSLPRRPIRYHAEHQREPASANAPVRSAGVGWHPDGQGGRSDGRTTG